MMYRQTNLKNCNIVIKQIHGLVFQPAKTPPSSKIVFHKQNGVKPAVINGLGESCKQYSCFSISSDLYGMIVLFQNLLIICYSMMYL